MDDDDEEEEKIIPNIRERAFSECIKPGQKKQRSISAVTLNRGVHSHYSDSNLSQIDKEKTFAFDTRRSAVLPGELLAKVVMALGGYRLGDEEEQKQANSVHSSVHNSVHNSIHNSAMGIHGFSDSQILASEQNYYSDWSIEASEKSYVTPPHKRNHRLRATSEIRIPIEQSVKVCNIMLHLSSIHRRRFLRPLLLCRVIVNEKKTCN
jgi:hypothetical protein